MNKIEKLVNLIFFLVILAAVSIVFGATLKPKKIHIKNRIATRFAQEIDEATMTDTAVKEKKQKIIEEEIQKDIIRIPIVEIPIVKIPVITIEIITPEIIRTIIVGLDKIQIEILAIKIYDVSYQARRFRKKINYITANANFKKYLREGNTAMVQNCLQNVGVDSKVIETLMVGLGQPVSKLKIVGFGEYVFNENAYIVEDYSREVQQNDLVIFDISRWSNVIKALEFVAKNKDKLDAVIIGWDSAGKNNLENKDVSTYPEIMENYEHFFSTCKAIAPKLPVGLCVTYTELTMYDWLKACPFKFDMLCVYNITKFGANFKKIQKRFPNQKLMIGGMNAGEDAEYGGTAYKNYILRIKKLGYIGSIFHK